MADQSFTRLPVKPRGRRSTNLSGPATRMMVSWILTKSDEKRERQRLAEEGAGFVHMIKVDEFSSDAEKSDEFLSEQALRRFDEYVRRFEELWEKYEEDPYRDQKIADELGCRLVRDEGDDAEVINEGSTDGAAGSGKKRDKKNPPTHRGGISAD